MPALSMFFGIIVYMYMERGGKHNQPHIHAKYQNDNIVIALNGEVLEGSFPVGKKKLLDAWMEIHHDELAANWELLQNGEQYFKIDPLK